MSITAIIPCYNAEAFLGEAIESVLAQTRAVGELIVVDDASTDQSVAIAERYPVTIIRQSENLGHAAARNVGIRAAQGDLLAWLDADDYWEPSHLSVTTGLLDRFPEAVAAFSGVRKIGRRRGLWNKFPRDRQPSNVFWECFRTTIVPAMSAVTQRTSAKEIGGFDATIRSAPDFDFWLRLARVGPFVSTSEVTAVYRWHKGQISGDPGTQMRSMYQTRRRLIESLNPETDSEFIQRLEAEARNIWNDDLADCWRRGNDRGLETLLSLAPLVRDGADVQRTWRRRARVPALLMAGVWQLSRPLRKALRLIGSQ